MNDTKPAKKPVASGVSSESATTPTDQAASFRPHGDPSRNGAPAFPGIPSHALSGRRRESDIRIVLFIAAACVCAVAGCLIALWHIPPSSPAASHAWFNPWDAGIVMFVNQFANSWLRFDTVVYLVEKRNLLKGGPIVALFWVAFFLKNGGAEEILERRRKIAATVPLALLGVVLARILAETLPFRERPLRTPAIHFQSAHLLPTFVLYGWSSFPSDHAAMFVALSVGLLIASRLPGSIALAYTFVFILFPRVYLGLHWPTDILAGAAIGAVLGSFTIVAAYRNFIWRWVMKCWRSSPGIFAGFLFLLSLEFVELFETPLEFAKDVLKHFLR